MLKSVRKCIIVAGLTLCMCLGLSACGGLDELKEIAHLGTPSTSVAVDLVQGNLDSLYLGKFNPDYLVLVESTEEAIEQDYLDGLEIEAEYFTYYWGIVDTSLGQTYADLDEDLKNDIIELYKEIYSKSKYDISSAVRQSDGSYAVKILIEPIDIMQQASDIYANDEYEPLNEFWSKYDDAAIEAMTAEDSTAYTHEYGEIIVQLVRDQLPNLGYLEQKSQSIQVEEDTDGYLAINSDDLGIFDEYVIYYP